MPIPMKMEGSTHMKDRPEEGLLIPQNYSHGQQVSKQRQG